MELGDGNFPPPFAPPPPEPFKFLFVCEPNEERIMQLVRQDWEHWVTGSVLIEDWERWNECKGLIFFSQPERVSYDLARLMRKFFARDGREALVYQVDNITHAFVGRDEKWLDYPGRFYHFVAVNHINKDMSSGTIAVDLDGTLAFWDGVWRGPDYIGEPIPRMVDRVRHWLAEGKRVVIFTARMYGHGQPDVATGKPIDVEGPIRRWCKQHLGQEIPVTCVKDFTIYEIWDDRAIQVIPNTGQTIQEKLDEVSFELSEEIRRA